MFQKLQLSLLIYYFLVPRNTIVETRLAILNSLIRQKSPVDLMAARNGQAPSVNNLGASLNPSQKEKAERGWRTVLDDRYYYGNRRPL